MRVFHDRLTTT